MPNGTPPQTEFGLACRAKADAVPLNRPTDGSDPSASLVKSRRE